MIRPLFAIIVALVTAATGATVGAVIAACDTARPTLLPRLTIPAPLVGLEDKAVAAAGHAPALEPDAGVGQPAPDLARLSRDPGPVSRAAMPVATRPKVARRSPERPAGGEAAPEPPPAELIDGVTVTIDDADDGDDGAPPPTPAPARPSRLGQTPIAEAFD